METERRAAILMMMEQEGRAALAESWWGSASCIGRVGAFIPLINPSS